MKKPALALLRKYWICGVVFFVFLYMQYCTPMQYDQWMNRGIYQEHGGFFGFASGYVARWGLHYNARLASILVSGFLESTQWLQVVSVATVMALLVYCMIRCFGQTGGVATSLLGAAVFFLVDAEIFREVYAYAFFTFIIPVLLVLCCCLLLQPLLEEDKCISRGRRIAVYLIVLVLSYWVEPVTIALFGSFVILFFYYLLGKKRREPLFLLCAILSLSNIVFTLISRADALLLPGVGTSAIDYIVKIRLICKTVLDENAVLVALLFFLACLVVRQNGKEIQRLLHFRIPYMVYAGLMSAFFLLKAYNQWVVAMQQRTYGEIFFGYTVLPRIFTDFFFNMPQYPTRSDGLNYAISLLFYGLLVLSLLLPLLLLKQKKIPAVWIYLLGVVGAVSVVVAQEQPFGARVTSFSVMMLCLLGYIMACALHPIKSTVRRRLAIAACALALYFPLESTLFRYGKINDIRQWNNALLRQATMQQLNNSWDIENDVLYQIYYGDEMGLFHANPYPDDIHYAYFMRAYRLEEGTKLAYITTSDEWPG